MVEQQADVVVVDATEVMIVVTVERVVGCVDVVVDVVVVGLVPVPVKTQLYTSIHIFILPEKKPERSIDIAQYIHKY